MTEEEIVNRLVDALHAEIDAIKASGVKVKNLHTYAAAIHFLACGVSEEGAPEVRAALVNDLIGTLCATVNQLVAAAPGRVQ